MPSPSRSHTDTQASEDARTIWRLADKARDEAVALRRRAGELDAEAKRLDVLATGIADGRPLSEFLP